MSILLLVTTESGHDFPYDVEERLGRNDFALGLAAGRPAAAGCVGPDHAVLQVVLLVLLLIASVKHRAQ